MTETYVVWLVVRGSEHILYRDLRKKESAVNNFLYGFGRKKRKKERKGKKERRNVMMMMMMMMMINLSVIH